MNYEKYYYMCKTYTWIEIDGDFAKCLTEKTKIGDECCEPDEENDPVNPFFEDVSPRDCKPLSRAFSKFMPEKYRAMRYGLGDLKPHT